jgi:hypothetical protein
MGAQRLPVTRFGTGWFTGDQRRGWDESLAEAALRQQLNAACGHPSDLDPPGPESLVPGPF